MRKIIFVSIYFFTTQFSLLAWPQGIWVGKGRSTTQSSKLDCEWIEIRYLRPSSSKLIQRGGGYVCGDIQAEYPYATFGLIGEDIIYDGHRVGRLTDDLLHISTAGEQYQLWLMKKTEDEIFFRELWADGEDFFMVEGKLFREQ
jgi:hypothetical protein